MEQTKLLEQEMVRLDNEKRQFDQIKLEAGKGDRKISEFKKSIQEMEKEIHKMQKAKDSIEEKANKRESMVNHFQKKIRAIADGLEKLSVSIKFSMLKYLQKKNNLKK